MSQEVFAGLIENFGHTIGLQGIRPDEEGYCAMSFDEIVVHFQYEQDQVTIFSRLGEVDEDRVEGIYGMLLAANIFWQGTKGATLSVEPDTGVVFIADRRDVEHLSDAVFSDWLGDFIDIAERWTERLRTANTGGPLFAAADEPVHTELGIEFS